MKNIKKLLAVLVALAMIIGLFATTSTTPVTAATYETGELMAAPFYQIAYGFDQNAPGVEPGKKYVLATFEPGTLRGCISITAKNYQPASPRGTWVSNNQWATSTYSIEFYAGGTTGAPLVVKTIYPAGNALAYQANHTVTFIGAETDLLATATHAVIVLNWVTSDGHYDWCQIDYVGLKGTIDDTIQPQGSTEPTTKNPYAPSDNLLLNPKFLNAKSDWTITNDSWSVQKTDAPSTTGNSAVLQMLSWTANYSSVIEQTVSDCKKGTYTATMRLCTELGGNDFEKVEFKAIVKDGATIVKTYTLDLKAVLSEYFWAKTTFKQAIIDNIAVEDGQSVTVMFEIVKNGTAASGDTSWMELSDFSLTYLIKNPETNTTTIGPNNTTTTDGPTTTTENGGGIKGDINGDGKVNGMDLLLMKQHILDIPGKKIYEGTPAFYAADMNDDGKINGMDILAIKKFIIG